MDNWQHVGALILTCILMTGKITFSAKPYVCEQCISRSTCRPPDCVCCSDTMPLPKHQLPQIVYFTFDDAVTSQVSPFYKRLFDSSRRNPNSCPITMTLFVSHNYTDYDIVREFYTMGMEIASHTVTHPRLTRKNFETEAREQRDLLVNRAGIPQSEIRGFRSPFLVPVGDYQPAVLKSLGYEYDATLTFSKKTLDQETPIPFTLDYGWPFRCQIDECPKGKHEGFWEIPVISVVDYLHQYPCVYVDGCINAPPNAEEAFRFLWDNFNSYYSSSRVPFGINMHAAWFYNSQRLNGMDRFIKKLLTLNDVYIVSVKDAINWMKHPTPLSQIEQSGIWSCTQNGNIDNSLAERPIRSSLHNNSVLSSFIISTVPTINTVPLADPGRVTPIHAIVHNSSVEMCLFGINCFPPDCLCPLTQFPPNWLSNRIPQIVYISVEGAFNDIMYLKLRSLFTYSRLNPNGCPIRGTFFLSQKGSIFSLVRLLRSLNMEIALKLNDPSNKEIDITLQNLFVNLYRESLISFDTIKGVKITNNGLLSTNYFDVVEQNLKYDSSVVMAETKNIPVFPYTLDYGLSGQCANRSCLGGRHRGIWEVPNIPYDTEQSKKCEYIDNCSPGPLTADDTYRFLWNNFNRHYRVNRAPFGLRLQHSWLDTNFANRFQGLLRFIDSILLLDDVYILSVADVVEWMRSPVDIPQVTSFLPWSC